jgi:hypothetical protein
MKSARIKSESGGAVDFILTERIDAGSFDPILAHFFWQFCHSLGVLVLIAELARSRPDAAGENSRK